MESKEIEYERKVDLKELLFRILCGWRKLLISAFVFTLIIGGFKFYIGYRSLYGEQSIQARENEYQTALSTYESSKAAIETEIINIQSSIDRQKDYNENSILNRINPFDVKIDIISYYVNTDYHIIPDLTYQNIDMSDSILRAYMAVTQNGDMYKYIIERLSYDIEIRFLKEIITITPEYDTKILTIQVAHMDSELCDELYNLILEYIKVAKINITNNVGEHTLNVISEIKQTNVDFNLEATQKNNELTLKNYEASLTERQAALSSLVKPEKSIISNSIVIISTIKYVIMGFFLGIFLEAFIILFSFLMSDKVFREKELRARFNLKVLGIVSQVPKKRIFKFVDLFIRRMFRVTNNKIDINEEIRRIAINITAICEICNIPHGRLVLTGSLNPELINNLSEKIQKEMEASSYDLYSNASIIYSANTINDIKNCNAVILVEKKESSTYSEILKQIECINDLEKKILGIILL